MKLVASYIMILEQMFKQHAMSAFLSLIWVQLYEHSPTSAYTFDEFSLGEKEYHEAECDEQRFQMKL